MDTQRMADTVDYSRTQKAVVTPKVMPTPVNPSCFGNIEDVRGTCESAAIRVERVVNRLCGPFPEQCSSELKAAPDGLLAMADEQARDIRQNMDRIFAALDRLEKHLP